MHSFLLNPLTWLAVVLALVSTLFISPTALAVLSPQPLAGVVLIAAVLLLVLAVFQSGRLPLVANGPGAGGNMRDLARFDGSSVIDVDFGDPQARAMTWLHIPTWLPAMFGGLLALTALSRRRTTCPVGA